jgi:hypothetical protein
MPAVNGFDFIGKISHTEAGNLLSMAPAEYGTALPVEWRDAKPTCDHCHTSRKRAETFIIRSPEGEILRVGRNCLADFVKDDPSQLIALALFQDSLAEIRESDYDDDSLPRGVWAPETFHFLACAVASTEVHGFKKSSEEESTAGHAGFLCAPMPRTEPYRQAWIDGQPTEEHQAQAVAIVTWLDTQDGRTSDYMHNLQVACQCLAATRKTQGLLASAPACYARAMGVVAGRKAEKTESKHVGHVGQRLDLEATIVRVSHYDTHFGTKTIVAMTSSDGSDLVTFTTSHDAPRLADVGRQYTVRATVKEHGAYQGRQQTTLTRAAFKPLTERA